MIFSFSSDGLKLIIQISPKDLKTSSKITAETERAGSNNHQPIKHMINRIDEILANLECAAVDGGFSLSVKDGEIVAKDLLSEEPLEFIIRFAGKDISDVAVKPLTKK